jgi:hypothetical protein
MKTSKINIEFRLEYLKGRNHLYDLGLRGNIILKWVLNKLCGRVQTQDRAGSGECGNQPLRSREGGEFRD